mmetsp:Transcript_6466/g.18056  ORF Transcript_6466/g.18056 Transcript_6466/m.18056 type:complete len:212 (+) Transcript_6466:791-1426(+)
MVDAPCHHLGFFLVLRLGNGPPGQRRRRGCGRRFGWIVGEGFSQCLQLGADRACFQGRAQRGNLGEPSSTQALLSTVFLNVRHLDGSPLLLWRHLPLAGRSLSRHGSEGGSLDTHPGDPEFRRWLGVQEGQCCGQVLGNSTEFMDCVRCWCAAGGRGIVLRSLVCGCAHGGRGHRVFHGEGHPATEASGGGWTTANGGNACEAMTSLLFFW